MFKSEAKIERLILSDVQNISNYSELTLKRSPEIQQHTYDTKISTLFCQIDGKKSKNFENREYSTLPRNMRISNLKSIFLFTLKHSEFKLQLDLFVKLL